MSPALLLALALDTEAPPKRELVLTPYLHQSMIMFFSDRVTSGGLGGGIGAEAVWRESYVARADVGMALLIGNTVSTRLAVGLQGNSYWSPAFWCTFGALWGDRIEFLADDGRLPGVPTWAVGLRGSPLRFRSSSGFFSALEPGAATDFQGGLWLEVTLVQAGAHW